MDEDQFNMEIRKFLKKVGVTSQREIEKAVKSALDTELLSGSETLNARRSHEASKLDLVQRGIFTFAVVVAGHSHV